MNWLVNGDEGDSPGAKRARMREATPPIASNEAREMAIVRSASEIVARHPSCDFAAVLDHLNAAVDPEFEAAQMVSDLENTGNDLAGPSEDPLDASVILTSDELARATTAGLDPVQISMFNACRQVFAEADADHVIELLSSQHFDSIEHLIDRTFGMSPCPHLSDMVTRGYRSVGRRRDAENRDRRRAAFLGAAPFDVDQFLRIYPDPEHYFTHLATPSASYRDHCMVFLQNQFPQMRTDFFERLLTDNGHRLLPVFRLIMDNTVSDSRRPNERRKRNHFGFPQFLPTKQHRIAQIAYPDALDEAFFREVQFCLNETTVKKEITRREAERDAKMARARVAGILVECGICLDDEVHPDDLVSCDRVCNPHSFCANCVRAHAETRIGDGACVVACPDDSCDEGRIRLTVLQQHLNAHHFQLLLRRVQQEELRTARLENMESCPFCDFAMIIENEQERLFTCLNPDCLKESCRECRGESHIPLRCDEVEKDIDVRRRTFIEERMAQAYMRHCPACGKGIVKSDGCNKMACSCGCYFCYVCNVELSKTNPYAHFKPDGCRQMSDDGELHSNAAKRAGEEAKREFDAVHGVKEKEGDVAVREINVDHLVEPRPAKSTSRDDLGLGYPLELDDMAVHVVIDDVGEFPEDSESSEESETSEEEDDSFICDETEMEQEEEEEGETSSSSSARSRYVEDADAEEGTIAVRDSEEDETSWDEAEERALDGDVFTDEDESGSGTHALVAWRRSGSFEDGNHGMKVCDVKKKNIASTGKRKQSGQAKTRTRARGLATTSHLGARTVNLAAINGNLFTTESSSDDECDVVEMRRVGKKKKGR